MQVRFYLDPFHVSSGPSCVMLSHRAAAQCDSLLIKQTCDQLAPSLVLETWMQSQGLYHRHLNC